MKLLINEEEKKSILEQYLGKAPEKIDYPFDFSRQFLSSLEDSVKLIKKHEGFCDGIRKCPPYTIGYGTRTDLHPELQGKKIDDVVATAYVKKDLRSQVLPSLKNFVKIPLTNNQSAALSSLIYNIGADRFRTSQLLKDLNAKNWDGVRKNWSEFVISDGKVSKGLKRRREDEINLFFSK